MLHTKTCNRLPIIQLLFFSSKAGKAKRMKKGVVRAADLLYRFFYCDEQLLTYSIHVLVDYKVRLTAGILII